MKLSLDKLQLNEARASSEDVPPTPSTSRPASGDGPVPGSRPAVPKLGLGLGASAAASQETPGAPVGSQNARQQPPPTARVPPLVGLGSAGQAVGPGASGVSAGEPTEMGPGQKVPRLPLMKAPSEPPLPSGASGQHGAPRARKLTPPKPLGESTPRSPWSGAAPSAGPQPPLRRDRGAPPCPAPPHLSPFPLLLPPARSPLARLQLPELPRGGRGRPVPPRGGGPRHRFHGAHEEEGRKQERTPRLLRPAAQPAPLAARLRPADARGVPLGQPALPGGAPAAHGGVRRRGALPGPGAPPIPLRLRQAAGASLRSRSRSRPRAPKPEPATVANNHLTCASRASRPDPPGVSPAPPPPPGRVRPGFLRARPAHGAARRGPRAARGPRGRAHPQLEPQPLGGRGPPPRERRAPAEGPAARAAAGGGGGGGTGGGGGASAGAGAAAGLAPGGGRAGGDPGAHAGPRARNPRSRHACAAGPLRPAASAPLSELLRASRFRRRRRAQRALEELRSDFEALRRDILADTSPVRGPRDEAASPLPPPPPLQLPPQSVQRPPAAQPQQPQPVLPQAAPEGPAVAAPSHLTEALLSQLERVVLKLDQLQQ